MASLAKIMIFLGVILLVVLTAVAGYSSSQIQRLSLSISQVLAIATCILPFATALSTHVAYRLRSLASRSWPALYIAIFALQLIYETILATLSITYMVPGCRLEDQWGTLYKNKDAAAIRRIQDRFNCCGLNTPVDRAWPFPHGRPEDGFGADQCRRMFGRDTPCSGPWGREERIDAGLLFTVAVVTFVVQCIILAFQLRANFSWMRFFRNSTTNGAADTFRDTPGSRLLIDENTSTAVEPYHDEEVGPNQEETTESRGNPGSTAGGGSAPWQE